MSHRRSFRWKERCPNSIPVPNRQVKKLKNTSTTTVTAGVMVAPVREFDGCCENTSLVATGVTTGAVMVKPALNAVVNPGLLAERL